MHGEGRLPDFLVIGAAKSGTTTLYHYLRRHPGIFMSPVKEPCFFDPEVGGPRGVAWYRSLFAEARADQLCGEASTNYTRWPQVPGVAERIAALLPRVKLVYLMRHPVERAYAHYVHRYTKEVYPGRPFSQSFEEFVESDPMCVDGSDYMLQIEQYLRHFPRESFCFLLLEELRADPASALRKIHRFLGVDEMGELAGDPISANDRESFHALQTRPLVTGPLRRSSLVRKLAALGPQAWRDCAYALLRRTPQGRRVERSFVPAPMREETRRDLLARYRDSNRALERKLDLDLSLWEGKRS